MAIERKMRQRVSSRPTKRRWPQWPKRERGEKERENLMRKMKSKREKEEREREPDEEDEEQERERGEIEVERIFWSGFLGILYFFSYYVR